MPALKECFSHDEEEICWLIKEVIFKAEGVFLWLEIVIKDIKRGARYNADSLVELRERLKITPNSIDGLYEQMLGRLDKLYLQEAGKYFRFLMVDRTTHYIPATLLEFVCAERVPWDHIRKGNTAWFKSLEFSEMCQHMETRLLTRCAGLVEVEHQSSEALRGIIESPDRPSRYSDHPFRPPNQEEHSVSYQLRVVKFIHKSALDFLQTHRPALLQERDELSPTDLGLLRGIAGVMSIMPVAISEVEYGGSVHCRMFTFNHISLTMHLLASFAASRASSEKPAFGSVAVQMVDDVYQIIERANVMFNGPDIDWYEYDSPYQSVGVRIEGRPFFSVHSFAAFLGCCTYVSYHRSVYTYSQRENNYVLACTIRGMMRSSLDTSHIPRYCTLIEDLLCRGADPNLSLDVRKGLLRYHCRYTISAWGACFYFIVFILLRIEAAQSEVPFVPNSPTLDQILQHFKALMECYLSHNADVNTSISHFISSYDDRLQNNRGGLRSVGVGETPLSYLKRAMNSKKHHDISPLLNSLQLGGALERRRFHLVFAEWDGGRRSCHLSEEESQRLCEVWPRQDGKSKEDHDSLSGALRNLEPSLYTYGAEDEKIIFNWESSW